MSRAVIIGTGKYLPDNIMTNDDLSNIVDTSDEWISTRTGIRQRRISTGMSTSDLAYEAGLRALNKSGLRPEDIDLIICATITPDYFMPSCACIIQDRLGAVNAAAFDLTAACTGMIYGMVTAEQFIKSGMYWNALVMVAKTLSKDLDWEDRSTCVLFGDGAGAVVMAKSEGDGGILTSNLEADGSKYDYLTCEAVPLENPYVDSGITHKVPRIRMLGQEVFKYAVRTITDNINTLLSRAQISKEEIKFIISHQANQRIIEQASKFIKIPIERFYMNLDLYGNTSAASIGIALDELVSGNEIKKGDKIILVGFGGGMTSGSILLEWS